MIIGIDVSGLTLPHPTGVQRYTEHLTRALLALPTKHTWRLYTPQDLAEPFHAHQVLVPTGRFWTQRRLPKELQKNPPDVFFQPGYLLPPGLPCKAVCTVHDIGWLHFPRAYSRFQYFLTSLDMRRIRTSEADLIVPSESTKTDCVELLRFSHEHIHVIPEALIPLPKADREAFPLVQEHKKDAIILAVGRLEERKNTTTLVEAFARLSKEYPQKRFTLVLIGQDGHRADKVHELIAAARAGGAHIILRSDANDAELAAWFSVASVLAYPSLYEGFGLPILQGFAANLPVVTTHTSSIPEIGGDAVLYIKDAKSPLELSERLLEALEDDKLRKQLVERGQTRLQTFSWGKAAKATLAVLEKQVHSK